MYFEQVLSIYVKCAILGSFFCFKIGWKLMLFWIAIFVINQGVKTFKFLTSHFFHDSISFKDPTDKFIFLLLQTALYQELKSVFDLVGNSCSGKKYFSSSTHVWKRWHFWHPFFFMIPSVSKILRTNSFFYPSRPRSIRNWNSFSIWLEIHVPVRNIFLCKTRCENVQFFDFPFFS